MIRPVNYVFDPVSQSVMFRSEPGSKLHALLHATRACFAVDDVDVRALIRAASVVDLTRNPVF